MLDEGVLRAGPVCEFGGALAVEACGGLVVTPWRDRYRAAESAELPVTADPATIPDAAYAQVVVHLQKGRAATAADLAEAWRVLAPEGQLLLVGSNALGVVSAVKRLARQLDQTPIVVANRARARAVRFRRDAGPGPEREATPELALEVRDVEGRSHPLRLETRPGVFSARRLDAGSALLLEALAEFAGRKPPRRLVDLGCGTGVLGLAAATLWPEVEVLMVDADARAVACARANAAGLGLAERCRVEWWEAREAPLDQGFDLALVNPPFHQHGPEVDLGPALALFDALPGWLRRNGRALVVANRTLPWEGPLEALGRIEALGTGRGYKLLSLELRARSGRGRARGDAGSASGSSSARARSSGRSGRKSPGARSGGRSSPPNRSR